MSQRVKRLGAIGCSALLWGVATLALAEQPAQPIGVACMPGLCGGAGSGGSGAQVNPCSYTPEQWQSVVLVSPSDAAPRDGLLFQATIGAAPGANTNLPPAAGSIVIEAVDAAGAATTGSAELSGGSQGLQFAWHPSTPLAANTSYELRVTLLNSATNSCAKLADVMQTFAITTVADLTPPPPEPPLRAIAYGRAWSPTARTCCVPLDKSACDDAEHCAKCWSAQREPTIVPAWDAPLVSTDLLLYALFYGEVTAYDPSTIPPGFAFDSVIPSSTYRPLAYGATFASDQTQVCMTGAVRNLRTGKVTLRTRCAPVTDDAGSLRSAMLPADVVLDPPPDPDLEIGPPACMDGVALPEGIDVAALYYSTADACAPQCTALFPFMPVPPITPQQPSAGTGASNAGTGASNPGTGGIGAPPATSTHPTAMQPGADVTDGKQSTGGGCRVAASAGADAPSAFLLWMATWVVHRLRRRRALASEP